MCIIMTDFKKKTSGITTKPVKAPDAAEESIYNESLSLHQHHISSQGDSSGASMRPYRRNQPRQPVPLEPRVSVRQEVEENLEQNMNLYIYLNKYLYTVNLMVMSCANFNLLGLIYMTDLVAQLICFYAFRPQNSYIDLKITRPFNLDLHKTFAWINISLSLLAMLIVISLQIMFKLKIETVEDSALHTMLYLVPNYNTIFTLTTTIITFLLSVTLVVTSKYEKKEQDRIADQVAKFQKDQILDSRLSKQLEYIVRDYDSTQNLLLTIHFLLFGITCAATVTYLNYPFQLIFAVESVTLAFTSLKKYKAVAGWTNHFLIVMLVLELFSQYTLALVIDQHPESVTLASETNYDAIGLLNAKVSFIVFYLKTALLITEFHRLQYQVVVEKVRNGNRSLFKWCLEPVSKVLYCSLAILFMLFDASVLFIPLIPFLITVMLGWNEAYKYISKGTFLILALYTLMLNSYRVYFMYEDNTLIIQLADEPNETLLMLGFHKNPTAMIQLFPPQYEYLILMLMAVFCRYSNLRPEIQQPDIVFASERSSFQNDETTNGKCWVCMQKSKKFMIGVFKQIGDAAIMHSTTLCMFICLFLVIKEHTVFNIWIFLLLQIMVWVPPHFEQVIWYLLMASSCAMIVSQYAIFIMKYESKEFCKIGLSLCEEIFTKTTITNPTLNIMRLYSTYYSIMLTSVICIFIVRSKTYNDLWAAYMQPDLNLSEGESEEVPIRESEEPLQKIDFFTGVYLKFTLYLLMTILALVSTTLPLSITNVLLLIGMTILVLRGLLYESHQQVFLNSLHTLQMIRLVSLLSCIMTFIAAFLMEYDIWFKKDSTEKSLQFWISMIFGFDQSLFAFRIITLTMCVTVSNTAVQLSKSKLSREAQNEVNDEQEEEPGWFKRTLIYIAYFLYLSLPVLLLTVRFTIALSKPSLLGVVAMLTTLILVRYQAPIFWRDTYIAFGILSQIESLVVYTMDFVWIICNAHFPHLLANMQEGSNSQILEILLSDMEMFKKDEHFFSYVFFLFIILGSCFLQKELMKLGMSFEHNRTKVIQDCVWIKDHVLVVFIYTMGYNLTQMLVLMIMLMKANVSSVLYLVVFWRIVKTGFYQQRFAQKSEDMIAKGKTAAFWLGLLVFLVQLVIFFEYLVICVHYFTEGKEIDEFPIVEKWETFVGEKLCWVQEESEKFACFNDWNRWLSIGRGSVEPRFFFWEFILVFVAYLTRAYINQELVLRESQLLQEPKFNDENDFTAKIKDGYEAVGNNLIFGQFPYVLILLLLSVCSTINNVDYITALSLGFMLIALSLAGNFRRFFNSNSLAIQTLRIYNSWVLVAILVFQVPALPCPYDEEGRLIYIPANQCQAKMGSRHGQNAYSVVFGTMGLAKLTFVPIGQLLIQVATEIQNWAFHHPYFKEYVLKRIQSERLDGEIRGFMFVQNFHLHRKWQYKSIKQQTQILDQRLQRTTREFNAICQQKEEIDQEQVSLLDTKRTLELKTPLGEILLEEICMQLNNSALPVVNFKKLLHSCQSLDAWDSMEEPRLREELTKKVSEMEKKVYYKNCISLYNTDGLGLDFVLKRGGEIYLTKSEYEFYFYFFMTQRPDQQKRAAEALINSTDNVSSSHSVLTINQSDDEGLLDQDSEQLYHEITAIQNDCKEEEKVSDDHWTDQFIMWVKKLLWREYTNKLLFFSLYDSHSMGEARKADLRKFTLWQMIQAASISQIEYICFMMMFTVFCCNANLLTMLLPLSVFVYALLDNPKPAKSYWNGVITYVTVLIAIKYMIQLPVFCSTPAWGVTQCSIAEIKEEVLIWRYDFLVGLQKFQGPASYPRDRSIFLGIFPDLILLVLLINLKAYQYKTGEWNNVKTDKNIQRTPKFKGSCSELNEQEIDAKLAQNLEYEELPIWDKISLKLRLFGQFTSAFFHKLMPRYMETTQPNLDLRTKDEIPTVSFDFQKMKPGADYFTGNFFTLMALFFFILFFYKNLVGQSKTQLIGAEIDLNHFQPLQVILLFGLMSLMTLERMLYRARTNMESSYGDSFTKNAMLIKICIHFSLVISVHLLLAFYWPLHQQIRMSQAGTAIVFYLIWVTHFVFSSLQIQHGYPQKPYQGMFMENTSTLMVNLFRIYKAIPFLWEMKVIIDWTVTRTSLDLYQWFRLDDAFNYVYFAKSVADSRAQRREFQPRDFSEKVLQGFCFAFGLIVLILIPIFLFSGLNPSMVPNPVLGGNLSFKFQLNGLGNEYYIFTSQAFGVNSFDQEQIDEFNRNYKVFNPDQDMTQYQNAYFTPYSESNWDISDPSIARLADNYNQLKSKNQSFVQITSEWQFDRDQPPNAKVSSGSATVKLPMADFQPFITLLTAQNSIATQASIEIGNLLPRILKVGMTDQSSHLDVYPANAESKEIQEVQQLSSLQLVLHKTATGNHFWTFAQAKDLDSTFTVSQDGDLVIVVYNDKVMSAMLANSLSLSVIGIYVTVVYTVGTLLRSIFERYSQRIIFEELPVVDKLFEICQGIFTAQHKGDMKAEKKLYDLLITVYRSPELMIKMTGRKWRYQPEENLEPPAQPIIN